MFTTPRRLTALTASSLCLVVGCMGGQSGDDGDVVGGGNGGFPTRPPAPLPEECGQAEPRPVEPDEETVFGTTPEQLVRGLAQPVVPFHWVTYETSEVTASHSPGPGSSSLTMSFTVRSETGDLFEDEAITETTVISEGSSPQCPEQFVVVPVWVELRTEDGALDARVKGQLTFYTPNVATLRARFAPEALGGTFELTELLARNPAYTWSVSSYELTATVWKGGSKGTLSPELSATTGSGTDSNSTVSPSPSTAPEPAQDRGVFVPERWAVVGVWPRLEHCAPGMAVSLDDPLIGRSARDVLDALSQRADFPLKVRMPTSSEPQRLDLRLTTTLSSDLVCVTSSPQSSTLEIAVGAHLSAQNANADVNLDTDVRLTVTGYVDPLDANATLNRVHFSRTLSDASRPQERAAFETSTGVRLTNAPAEYTQIWWTWFGAVSSDASARHAAFVVSAPNAEQSAIVAQQIAAGGPGFAVIYDETSQQLPGDVLLEATLESEP